MIIYQMMFDKDYFLKDQVQDEFRGLEANAFIGMDLGKHFKELKKKKAPINHALQIIMFVKVITSILNNINRVKGKTFQWDN
jgi:hypothetical protein